jgi:hypothetical protein
MMLANMFASSFASALNAEAFSCKFMQMFVNTLYYIASPNSIHSMLMSYNAHHQKHFFSSLFKKREAFSKFNIISIFAVRY